MCHPTGDAENVKPLIKANLARINAMASGVDNVFVTSHIQREGIQQYERALYSFLNDHQSEEGSELQELPVKVGTSIESVVRQYHASVCSSAGPLERFCLMSTQDEPCPIQARNAMEASCIDEGSLEKVDLRADTTRSVAEIVTPRKSSSTKVATSDACSESDTDCDTRQLDADSDHESILSMRKHDKAIDRALAEGKPRKMRTPRMMRRKTGNNLGKRRRA